MSANKVVPLFLEVVVLISLVVTTCVSVKPSNREKCLNTIKEVNRKGPYIGLITVFPPEAGFQASPYTPICLSCRKTISGGKDKWKESNLCEMWGWNGTVNGAAATQQMVDFFDVKGVVHFGIAGNVNNSMFIGDVTIPQQFAHTALWDWLNPNATLDPSYVAHLDFKGYNVPKSWDGSNLLGRLGYNSEQFFSESWTPNIAQPLLWAQVTMHWLQLATNLEVGLISLSNGLPVIVIRGLSDIAGRQSGPNDIQIFGSLAARNTAEAVVQFIKKL
ncbi:hypothetical protein EZV62_025262 [Acer yangbiense]|uniref:Nucleoside phosphorylase domain-containing protein n=1 Tax=Acer yangbiense TaxID=1000413 RepID=A0A5C7GY12_9ROSI|nr:hypothetical protein EZV62_025262 [Acer yangbiense]